MSRRTVKTIQSTGFFYKIILLALIVGAYYAFKDPGKFGDKAFVQFGQNFRTQETLVNLEGDYNIQQLEFIVKTLKEKHPQKELDNFKFPESLEKKPNQ